MLYKQLHKIGLAILIIGLLNIYNIVKGGIKLNIPDYNNSNLELFTIDINNIKIAILVTILLSIIINSYSKSTVLPITESSINRSDPTTGGWRISKRESIEYELLLGLGLIGLIVMIISNETIILYLGLELYSYTIYVLILVKETLLIRRISIIYLILSSLMSALILYSFAMLYKNTGTLNIEAMYNIITGNTDSINIDTNYTNKIIYLIILGFLFKLGTGPFMYWVLRVYGELDKRILWYQLIIPKFVFFILLLKFLSLIHQPMVDGYQVGEFSTISYTLYLIAIVSIIVGAVGGLFQTRDNMLLSYSSILNIGFILLSLSIITIVYSDYSDLFLFHNILENNQLWVLIQYFIVYIVNLLGLFSVIHLYYRSSNVFNYRSFFQYPFFFLCFIILILSFIGIPPLSGFFSKFYLFYTLFSYPQLSTLSLSIFILSTLISSFFYFKFLFASSADTNSNSIIQDNYFSTLLLSFSTIFTVFYPFYFSSLLPFYTF